jgi:hypothetical protein
MRWRARGLAPVIGSLVLAAATAPRAAEPQAEIQINLCSEPAQIQTALRLEPQGQPTTVWLFDTPTQALQRQDLRLRLRERGKTAELTLKVGGQACSKVSAASLGPDGKCESDLHGDSIEDVVSVNAPLKDHDLQRLLSGPSAPDSQLAATLEAALTHAQRTWLASRRGVAAGAPLLPSDLLRLGPSSVQRYRAGKGGYDVEVWTIPAGERFVELSEKVRRDVALRRRSEWLARLAQAGVAVCADQASQARVKLERLSSR